MNHKIVHIISVILRGRSPNITIPIPIPLEHSIDRSEQNVASNIELPIFNKITVFNILLHNNAVSTVLKSLVYFVLQRLLSWMHRYPETPVWILTRLDNPHILWVRLINQRITVLIELCQSRAFFEIDIIGNRHNRKRIYLFAILNH